MNFQKQSSLLQVAVLAKTFLNLRYVIHEQTFRMNFYILLGFGFIVIPKANFPVSKAPLSVILLTAGELLLKIQISLIKNLHKETPPKLQFATERICFQFDGEGFRFEKGRKINEKTFPNWFLSALIGNSPDP